MVEPVVESSAETVLNIAKAEAIRVLHVDDDQTCLKVVKQCLDIQGEFEVDTASSVDEALEKLKKTDYDAIISDYQMPDKDGLELLKELRKKGNTIPFIIFTGKGREEIAMKALNLGASGYFTKQGQPETVYDELAHGIRQAAERRKTETTICEREERLRAVFSSSPDAIILCDLHGNILDCNEAAGKVHGFSSKEEVIGKSSSHFVAEKDHQKALENLKKMLEQGTTRNAEYTLLNKDGEEFWGERSASIIKDSLGNPLGFVVIMRDITERKKMEEKLRQNSDRIELMNEKLRVVGGLARHDVNNKLSAVTGYAYLLEEKHADQADIVEGLGMMEQAVKEVGKIFDFARMYEKLGVEELTYVDVEKTLDEAVALSGLTIKVVNGCHGLTVLADSFLGQLFYNLIDNTRKYGGKATAVRVYYEKAESGELRLVYEDDGVGIFAENKLKLFTEGFSTGGSTGFGLFLIRKMMEVYGWTIQETGTQGTGAHFTISIPRTNTEGKENFRLS